VNKLILLTLSVVCCLQATAQTKSKPAAVKQATVAKPPAAAKSAAAIVEAFFKKYKDDGTSQAIDYLFATNKLFSDTSQIAVLKVKLMKLRQSEGQYLGKELIAQKNAGASLTFFSYLIKFENQPVRFTFTFYKPKDEWVLYHFKYDDQLDTELEQAGKIK